ncbi:hypothetical protein TRIUR3_12673 [Triticum urartu]|uniref:Uncharacterized protein n=1 Tax=Triticum urartu TaxID=4572 RepID=M7YJ62_TRIUA|nr:hypothetical protein TRIUR3_12673 [Triticum urartu]
MAPKVPRQTGTTTEVSPSSTKIAVYNYRRLGLRQVHRRPWFHQDHLEYDYHDTDDMNVYGNSCNNKHVPLPSPSL